ncbi:MAG: CPBP family glutamic-type intramembrane protease [Nitrospinota bacterium]|nr:CPBP family glutamic-type intramembrane protease [Nitrospinota bacterium]
MLKASDSRGNWGLKGPVSSLILLYFLLHFAAFSIPGLPDLSFVAYGLVVLFLVVCKKAKWKQLGLHSDHWMQNLVLGGLAGGVVLASVPLMDWLIDVSGLGQSELFAGAENRDLDGSGEVKSFPIYLGLTVTMVLAEQLFFTGYLIQSFLLKIKPALAIYLGGIIFTLVHNDFKLGLFLLGTLTATFYHFTRSLVPSLLFQLSCSISSWLLTYQHPRVFTLLGFLF